MRAHPFGHLCDRELLRVLDTAFAQERTSTATLLGPLAEVDARRLYLAAGYSSMYAFCVDKQGLSEDSAHKRIRAARTARQFPAVLDAVTEGRLNLSGVVLLTPYLTPGNADGLLAATVGKKNVEIEELLARRFPRTEMLPMVILAQVAGSEQLAVRPVCDVALTNQLAVRPVLPRAPRPKLAPIAPERYSLQITIGKSTHDKLQYAEALLSHCVRSGDLATVLDRALDALIKQLEQRKFGATDKPCPPRPGRPSHPRSIPAHVRRAVWQRDRGQCTFIGDGGHRCSSRTRLEFDHVRRSNDEGAAP